VAACPATVPVDDAGADRARDATLPRMSIQMPAAEVFRLANALRGASHDAEEICMRLPEASQVGGGLRAAVDTFLESHRTAGRAFASELAWLGDTVASVADSWLRLDGSLVTPRGRMRAE
jgi:hypothetical protein